MLCDEGELHGNIATYPCCMDRLHLPLYLVPSAPCCLSPAWDESSSSAEYSLELMLRLTPKGGDRALILHHPAAALVISSSAEWA